MRQLVYTSLLLIITFCFKESQNIMNMIVGTKNTMSAFCASYDEEVIEGFRKPCHTGLVETLKNIEMDIQMEFLYT